MDLDDLHDDFDENEYLGDDMDEDLAEGDDGDDVVDTRKRKRGEERSSNGSNGSGRLPRRAAKKPKGISTPSPRVGSQDEAHGGSSSPTPLADAQPPSFSAIDPETLLDPQAIAAKFPLFARAAPLRFELNAGEMLWLPAGWFHEVVSFSNPSSQGQGHAAFNYWMHPPTCDNFEHPYPDGYWKEKFGILSKWVSDKLNPLPAGVVAGSPPKVTHNRQRAPPRPFDDFFEPSDDDDTPARRRAALRRNPRVVGVSKSFKPPSGAISAAEGAQAKVERKLPLRYGASPTKKRK